MNLKQLIEFFDSQELTEEPITLNQATIICNQKNFVKSHINYLKANTGNKAFEPYYSRLIELYKILTNGSK
ncbi:hypothetical protein M1M25_gp029 [Tenacibaculum phage Gundel_1]|uniref:DUF6965 domain-containing protein n=1 Tax=Tenacibaculum phage Gundel_1 TaxID=2745672 RepID=A0A8E4ZMU6_9CAUD|nr:hypothetical protein M1M25_gp029 [Tenacibaculum phage Gundel_1]QQV91460.1 hypothetical protein Gundel1_29 [Tenacibaculum phage Gundel_1]